MARWAVIVAVALTATGCDWAFGLFDVQSAQDAQLDSPGGDAQATHPCLGRTPKPIFCGDFDEAPITVYVNGLGTGGFPADTSTSTAKLRAPSTTGSSALWIDSTGGPLYAIYSQASPLVHSLDASFALNISGPAGMSTGLFRLTLSNGTATNYVNLEVTGAPQRLILNGFYNGDNEYTDVFMGLPLGWVHVDFAFDRSTGVASISLDGGAPAAIHFVTTDATTAAASFQLGFESPDNLAGFSVGYDDLTITGL